MGLRADIDDLIGMDVPSGMTEDREQKVFLAIVVDMAKTLRLIRDEGTYLPEISRRLGEIREQLPVPFVPVAQAAEAPAEPDPWQPRHQPSTELLAGVAYSAYGEAAGWTNHQGGRMPEWGMLPANTRSYWVAATAAVRDQIEAPF